KRAPFYSVSELHMVEHIDDPLYQLLAPSLTAVTTPGINVNTMNEMTLRALIPEITDEEVKEFFTFRDSPTEDHLFRTADNFFQYLKASVSSLRSDSAIDQLKESLQKRNIRIVTDETHFKISVRAEVKNASKIIEAWVTLKDEKPSPQQQPGGGNSPLPERNSPPDAGLKIVF